MKKIALGQACPAEIGVVETKVRLNDDERLAVLEQQISYLITLINALRARVKRESESIYAGEPLDAPHGLNKDGVPIGLVCIGETEKRQFPVCLVIEKEHYSVGSKQYPSLSAAAEDISGVRRSGWAFWKLPDGRTLKQALNKR